MKRYTLTQEQYQQIRQALTEAVMDADDALNRRNRIDAQPIITHASHRKLRAAQQLLLNLDILNQSLEQQVEQ